MAPFKYGLLVQDQAAPISSALKVYYASKFQFLWFLAVATVSFCLGLLSSMLLAGLLASPACASVFVWSSSLAAHLGENWQRFQGGLFDTNLYRGQPSQSVDDAWARYTESRWFDGGAIVLSVTEDDIARSHKTGEEEWFNSTVRLDETNGGGYMATLELFHQLHCVDMIRKYTYPDYYPIESFRADKSSMRDHIGNHCIDIIRQALMCWADPTLITFHWAEGVDVPMPDFYTWHQCRDPEQILQWAKDHEARITHPISKPKGVIQTPKRLWGT